MKKIGSALTAVVLFGSLAGTALAVEGEPAVEQGLGNYCHIKLPAIRPSTLASDQPEAKSASTGDVIDYYGPCDETPTGQDQVVTQKRQEQFRFDRDYSDGD